MPADKKHALAGGEGRRGRGSYKSLRWCFFQKQRQLLRAYPNLPRHSSQTIAIAGPPHFTTYRKYTVKLNSLGAESAKPTGFESTSVLVGDQGHCEACMYLGEA